MSITSGWARLTTNTESSQKWRVMSPTMELEEMRGRWNEVLDALLLQDRVAWLAFFDARLADFDGKTLTLDFSDSRKLGSAHEYSEARIRAQQLLSRSIQSLFSLDVTIVEK